MVWNNILFLRNRSNFSLLGGGFDGFFFSRMWIRQIMPMMCEPYRDAALAVSTNVDQWKIAQARHKFSRNSVNNSPRSPSKISSAIYICVPTRIVETLERSFCTISVESSENLSTSHSGGCYETPTGNLFELPSRKSLQFKYVFPIDPSDFFSSFCWIFTRDFLRILLGSLPWTLSTFLIYLGSNRHSLRRSIFQWFFQHLPIGFCFTNCFRNLSRNSCFCLRNLYQAKQISRDSFRDSPRNFFSGSYTDCI